MDIPKYDHDALKALFAAEPLARDSFGLYYAYGFVLQLVSAPDIIQPSEWLAMVFKSRELPEFKSKKQMQAALGGLISIWSFWAEETADSEILSLPPDCSLDGDGNRSTALIDFCRGYLEGSEWLRDLWDEALESGGPDSAEEEIAGTAMSLCLRIQEGDDLPDDGSETIRKLKSVPLLQAFDLLPAALTDVAALGRALHMESLRQSSPIKAAPKPGRNDPCPCGSGKKYKKCCFSFAAPKRQ